jgi:hypothetical protein
MKKLPVLLFAILIHCSSFAQNSLNDTDSLKKEGLLMPALMKYGEAMANNPSKETSYKLATTTALLWNAEMRDTSFHFLNIALQNDSTLTALYDPEFLSLIEDPKWEIVENIQIRKFEAKNGSIGNEDYTRELFRMIIKDQGFMYAGNIEREKYMKNGGYFSSPAIYPVLAMEAKNKEENEVKLLQLLDEYGWPTASQVTEYAAAGAALVINHASYELRKKFFPMLEEAFKKGEAQPLRYAKMCDRLLVEEGKQQLFGTQLKYEQTERVLHSIEEPEYVEQ